MDSLNEASEPDGPARRDPQEGRRLEQAQEGSDTQAPHPREEVGGEAEGGAPGSLRFHEVPAFRFRAFRASRAARYFEARGAQASAHRGANPATCRSGPVL